MHLLRAIGFVGLVLINSCMVEYVVGPRGPKKMPKSKMKVYDKTKQMYLFGILNLSKRNYPQIPNHPYWQLRIKYNFGDAMIYLLTLGIVGSRTFIVYVPEDTSYVAYEYGFASKPKKGFNLFKKHDDQKPADNSGDTGNAKRDSHLGNTNTNILSPLAMRLKMLLVQEMSQNSGDSYVPSQYILQEYPVSNINGTYMVDLLVDVSDVQGAENIIFQLGGLIRTKAGSIWTVAVPLDKFLQIDQYSDVFKYVDVAQKVTK